MHIGHSFLVFKEVMIHISQKTCPHLLIATGLHAESKQIGHDTIDLTEDVGVDASGCELDDTVAAGCEICVPDCERDVVALV